MNAPDGFMREYWRRIREHLGESDPPTWWDNFRARLYTGFWYGTFMSRDRGAFLPPVEEAYFVRALMDATRKPSEWQITEYEAKHEKSGVVFWIANGRSFVSIKEPMRLCLRVRSQRRLIRAAKRIARTQLADHVYQVRSITLTLQGSQ